MRFLDLKKASGDWNLLFRRELFEWEKLEWLRLVSILSSCPSIRRKFNDYTRWVITASGTFSVSSLYFISSLAGATHPILSKQVWSSVLPPKVQFFGWLAWKQKVKTAAFLQRIGILNGTSSMACSFSKNFEESVFHVLLHCPFVCEVWSTLLRWWGVEWAIPGSVEGVLL